MLRRDLIIGLGSLALAGCTSSTAARIGVDGLPVQQVYNIKPGDEGSIQFRMLDSVNALRRAAGASPVQLDSNLTAAAATHARDMSLQNRPWLFGSDGSSPLDRATRAGFRGRFLGENISESFETELETLAAWMQQENTRAVILDANARRMGFAWLQEQQGKIWWTLNMGTEPRAGSPDTVIRQSGLATSAGSTADPFQLGTL